MTTGIIFDIKRYAINDGPGIRTAVFFKGCPLECWWCHNPEGQTPSPQLMVRQNRCKSSFACVEVCPQDAIHWVGESITEWEKCDQCGKCAEVCYAGAREMVGREVSPAELMAEIERDIPFYDQSAGGVTFTGGEPMMQADFLVEMLSLCKTDQIHVALDTSGQSSWENFERILPLVNLFLFDLKLVDAEKHKKYTSVTNKLILDNLHKLSDAGAHLLVRVPLIPGINDDDENLEQSAVMLAGLSSLDGVEFMPYHDIGLGKFQALGMANKLPYTESPSKKRVQAVEELFSSYDLPVIRHPGGPNDD